MGRILTIFHLAFYERHISAAFLYNIGMTVVACQFGRNLCTKTDHRITVIISAKKNQSLPQKTSQRKLADLLQVAGLDIDKNAIQRIESGMRFVTDIELKIIADVLQVSYQDLLDP